MKYSIKYSLGLLLALIIIVCLGFRQKTYACEICKNRTMPIYSAVFDVVQDVLGVIPISIKDVSMFSAFDEINIRQFEIRQKKYQACLREGSEVILGQDIRSNATSNVSRFINGYENKFSSLLLTDIIQDITIVKQAEVLADEYKQLSILHDKINDRIVTLSQNCAHQQVLPIDIQNQLSQIFKKHTNILIPAPDENIVLLNSLDSPLQYQDILLFLKDFVSQGQYFVSKGDFTSPDFYKKKNDKNVSQQSLYRNINMRINPAFVKTVKAQYACVRNTSLDIEKVCRRQEAQFGEIIKRIVGEKNIDAGSEYGTKFGEDRKAVKNQLNNDTMGLKGSYKKSTERIENAIKLLRESNFGLKNNPVQDQLLETYYNKSMINIRENTLRQEIKKPVQFIGKDPNPNNNTQYISPTQTKNIQTLYNTMTLVFDDVLSDMSIESSEIAYYDSTPQIQFLPQISKKIYQAMITLGNRNEAGTLINGLNLVCKHACGPEGNCG